MAPFPLRQLEVTDFDRGYEDAKGPFVVKSPSNREYVVVSAEDFGMVSSPMNDSEKQMILEDFAAARRGEVLDAQNALDALRAKYGI